MLHFWYIFMYPQSIESYYIDHYKHVFQSLTCHYHKLQHFLRDSSSLSPFEMCAVASFVRRGARSYVWRVIKLHVDIWQLTRIVSVKKVFSALIYAGIRSCSDKTLKLAYI